MTGVPGGVGRTTWGVFVESAGKTGSTSLAVRKYPSPVKAARHTQKTIKRIAPMTEMAITVERFIRFLFYERI
jgi:hypothetical protein